MEKQNFLQRPGGLGPTGALKPLGMSAAQPASYMNDAISMTSRRQAYTDDVNRVFAQYNIDHGTYMRAPVNPLPYADGNITKSAEVTGLAGYNHQEMPLPERPMDMSAGQYVHETVNQVDPAMRANVQALTLLPQQNFLNNRDLQPLTMQNDYRRRDDLLLQEQVLGGSPSAPK
jgi:hypothetical protein